MRITENSGAVNIRKQVKNRNEKKKI